jgi:PAS domain S-box-containing protein
VYYFFPYILLSILSFVTLIILSIYGFSYKDKVGVKEFIFAMLASAWWVFCQAFELMAVTLPVKLFWANLVYLGAGLSAFAYLMLVMRFSGYERLLTKKSISMVLIIYAIFFSLVFTDQYHGLMRTNFSLNTSAIPYTIDKDYGIVFPIYLLFIYSMNVSSLGLLFKTILNKGSHYRKQAAILFAGLGIIALSNLTYFLGLFPGQRFDMAPALFGLSALVVFWGVFQYKLLNIMPIARSVLVEMMNSGIIVLDKDNLIVDINHSALAMFHLGESKMVGENITEIPFFAENRLSGDQGEEQTILKYSHDNKEFVYEIKTHPFNEKREKRAGMLYIINDITEQQKNLDKLIQQQKALSIMRERERLGRELHDGLGQMFGYYSIQAQTVKEYMSQQKYETAMKKLEDLICVSRDTHSDIREYILEIRGIPPRNRSFSAALKHYIATFSEKYDLPVTINFDEDLPDDFPEDAKAIQLLRIIQEALNNIQKHAGKCTANISFSKIEGFVEIKISDTGSGFDRDKQVGSYHYGLSIMQERAKEIGAEIDINSEKGKGTEIILRILDGEVL